MGGARVRILVKAIEARCTVTEWLRSQQMQLLERRVYTPTALAEVQMEAVKTFLRTDVVFS